MSRKLKAARLTSVFSLIFLLASISLPLFAQQKTGDEKVLIGGKKYTLYNAVSGDTPFSIARKFNVFVDELYDANPEIKDKLNAGQTLKIPVQAGTSQTGIVKDSDSDVEFIYYSVRKNETVFSIAQKRNIRPELIYVYNPKSKDGIQEGEVLKIPKSDIGIVGSKAVQSENPKTSKHIVGKNESLYAIAKQHNTTQEEILKLNPSAKGNISKGTVLMIPPPSAPPPTEQKIVIAPNVTEYVVVGGDNFYQFEKRFGVYQAELIEINPSLTDGVKIGMTIKIPVKPAYLQAGNALPDSKVPVVEVAPISTVDPNKTYQIGIYLPFCQNLNDSTINIAQKTTLYLDFYSGIMLATQKLTDSGMKLKLNVYDTYQDNKVIEKLIKNPEFLSLDLIIGPVFPENEKIVADLSAKNHIPMVSPLSSDSRYLATTPAYFQINPAKKSRLTGTADYIFENFLGQNIILLKNGTSSPDETVLNERLKHWFPDETIKYYNLWAGGAEGLAALLKPDAENIIVLTEPDEANVSVAMMRLNTISKTTKITVVGLQEYTKMQSLDVEHLHNIRFHFLSPYFIDYTNAEVIAFIQNYRAAYNNEPTQYSFQGYDIASYFFTALSKSGKNFAAMKQKPGVKLLHADYEFQKASNLGGYMNTSLYVLEYTENFEVKSVGKVGVTESANK